MVKWLFKLVVSRPLNITDKSVTKLKGNKIMQNPNSYIWVSHYFKYYSAVVYHFV